MMAQTSLKSRHGKTFWWIMFFASIVILASWYILRVNFRVSPLSAINRCDKLCGRTFRDCFERDYTVIAVGGKGILSTDTFQQLDQLHGINITPIAVRAAYVAEGTSDTVVARAYCNVSSIDPAFTTLARRRSCAIVGNSGILLGSGCGRSIDYHDFVIRANLAPVEGYASDVGRRTDLMLINDLALKCIQSTLSGEFMDDVVGTNITKMLHSLNGSTLWFPKDARRHNTELIALAGAFKQRRLNITLAYSLKDIYYDIKVKYNLWRYPSSGLYMLAVAESICDVTSIFGFYPYETVDSGRAVLRHYYEPDLKHFHTWAHDFDAEFRMLQSRRDAGLVNMITDTTCRAIG